MIEKVLSVIPYAGLSPYDEEDAPFFFGRKRLRDILIANLKAKRLTLVFGASGVGKSSVLRAGVAYKLRRKAQENLDETGVPGFAVAVFNDWVGDPLTGLTACVQEAVRAALDDPALDLAAPTDSLPDTLKSWAAQLGGDLYIILDQFEEYFLYHGSDGNRRFTDEVVKVINRPDLHANFLITIRDDALAKIKRLKDSRFFDNLMEIEHLDREAATDAIEKPIEQYNLFYAVGKGRVTIEPELVEAVLKQLSELRAEGLSPYEGGNGGRAVATTAQARIEAPFLQLVMRELWKQEMGAGSTTLRLATLDRMGDAEMSGTKRVVKTHVAQVMAKLTEDEQAIAARILSYLVTPSGDKSARSASDLAESLELERAVLVQLLEKLAQGENRILRAFASPGAEGESRYEIFHDVLGPALIEWRRGYTQRLKEQQAEAERQRAMAQARAEEQARAARRRRVLYRIIAALLLVSLAGAAYAWRQQEIASEQRRHRYILRKSDLSNQTLARLNRDVIEGVDPQKVRENLGALLKRFNQTLEFYRADGNQEGEGITLNSIAGLLRLSGKTSTRLGDYQQAQDDYRQAREDYEKAQSLLENTLGPDHPEVATSLNDRAVIEADEGRYKEAEPLLRQSLLILEKVVDEPNDRYLAEPITNLAECLNAQGKYSEAEPLYERALQIRRDRLPADHPDLAESLNNLAWFYYEQGEYARAESLFNQSLAIKPNDADPDSPFDPAAVLNGLGAIYRKRGQYGQAATYFQDVLKQHGNLLNTDLPTLADDYENVGLLYKDQGRYQDAEPLFDQALLFLRRSYGENHPLTAYALSNLADLYSKTNRPAKAEQYFDAARQIQQVAVPQSPVLAQTLSGLARLYANAGKYADAETLFKDALLILESATPNHPDMAQTLNDYAALLQKMSRADEATQLQERARQIQDAHDRQERGH